MLFRILRFFVEAADPEEPESPTSPTPWALSEEEIGRGGCCRVHVATKRDRQVALKIPRTDDVPKYVEENYQEFLHEYGIMRNLPDSPYLLQLEHRSLQRADDGSTGLALPLLEPVSKMLKERDGFPGVNSGIASVHLLEALLALHDAEMMHGDVKPHNFLYNRLSGYFVLCDFGTVSRPPYGSQHPGTPGYRAPNKYLSPASDIFSAGVCIAEFLGMKRTGSPEDYLRPYNLEHMVSPAPAKRLTVEANLELVRDAFALRVQIPVHAGEDDAEIMRGGCGLCT